MTTPERFAVEPAPVFDLDLEKIGSMLRALPAISARVGHKTLKGTTWYGGQENAGRYQLALAEAAAAAIPRKRRAAQDGN